MDAPPHDQESPEVQQFMSLPQEVQAKLLSVNIGLLAVSALRYGGDNRSEDIVMRQLQSAPYYLRATEPREGNNVLGLAIRTGNASRAQALIEIASSQVPDVLLHRNAYRETLAMLQVSFGTASEELLRTFIEADITQVYRLYDTSGQNLLHHCVRSESISPLQTTLALVGQQLQQQQENGQLAWNMRLALEMSDNDGNTPLHSAAANNREDMLKLIYEFTLVQGINLEFDVLQHRGNRRTPLMEAAANDAVNVCRFLIDRDLVDIDITDGSGRRAAELTENQEIKQMLREYEESIHAQVSEQQPQMAETSKFMPNDEGIDSGVGTFDAAAALTYESKDSVGLTDHKIRHICSRITDAKKSEEFFEKLKNKFSSAYRSIEIMLNVESSIDGAIQLFLQQIRTSPNACQLLKDLLHEMEESELSGDI